METLGIAVITGGAGAGIGQGISHHLAQVGWDIAILDTDTEAIAATLRELGTQGKRCWGITTDVADESSVSDAFRQMEAEFGTPAALVSSAGRGLVKPLAEVTSAEWDAVHAVDLRGAFLAAKFVIPHLIARGGGPIVNIGSVQALGPHLGYSTYAAAKAGLVGLTKGIAADYGTAGIRCSIIHPGFVDSPQGRELIRTISSTPPDEWVEEFVRTRQMIPRTISPEDIGAAVAFLLSDGARFITGAELVVDAGSSIMAWDREGIA